MELREGLLTVQSNLAVETAVQKLISILDANGIKLFALIDHSGEAEAVGIPMRPTRLLVFGNPKAGTPLMLAAPTAAIDLPLKILVAEDEEGRVWVTYNDPAYLQARHGFPAEMVPNIAGIVGLVSAVSEP